MPRGRIVWSRPAMAADEVVIDHPNRGKAASKATRMPGRAPAARVRGPRRDRDDRRVGRAGGRQGAPGRLHRAVRRDGGARRALEPRRPAGRRRARDRHAHLRRDRRARLVRARQGGLRPDGPRRERARARDAADRAGPGAPHPRRDVGLPPGLERRGRAPARTGAGARCPSRARAPPPRTMSPGRPGWRNWSDARRSKRRGLRAMWVRVPPRVPHLTRPPGVPRRRAPFALSRGRRGFPSRGRPRSSASTDGSCTGT